MEEFTLLKDDLKTVEMGLIDNWYEDAKQVITEECENRSGYVKEVHDKIIKLQKELQQYSQHCDKSVLSVEQKSTVDELTCEINKLRVTDEEQKQIAHREQENIENMENSNVKTQQSLQQKESVVDMKLEKLEKGIRFFEENLQLKLEIFPESHLKFNFTSIDENDSDRIFWFSLEVKGSPGIYKVLECFPSIADVEILVKELNESNNLKMFLCKIRKSFKASLYK